MTLDYTSYGVDLTNYINFMGLINLVVESKLYRNQIRLTFQCVGSKIVMQYIDDSEVEIFVNIVTSMSH